jgi:FMN phosphatase YigB (HAD superfamily)
MLSAPTPPPLLVLFDVDNTLLDNDRFTSDLDDWLEQQLGAEERTRYWRLYEELRQREGYADYLGVVQAMRSGSPGPARLMHAAEFLLEYSFAERLYPGALAALAHLATLAPVAILSDGDFVFQPRKIRRSGLEAAVSGRVLLCVHKQDELDTLQARFPAAHYVMVDDKPRLLAAMKAKLGEKLTTIFVRQGHYAAEAVGESITPPPDHAIDHIAQLCQFGLGELRGAATLQESP